MVDGVLLNSHGAGGLQRGEDPGVPRPHTGLIHLAEKKLFGNNLLLNSLIKSGMVSTGSRVVYAGTEAARGLESMGFPVPNLQPSPQSMLPYLNGSGYEQPFQWQHAYSHIGAILSLYVGGLAQQYPNVYFATVSPGMTQESLNGDHVPHASVFHRLIMLFNLYICFPVFKAIHIAHDYSVGASYFVRAMTGTHEWAKTATAGVKSGHCHDDSSRDYDSGSFVGALELTSGPIGDQYNVPNGTIFRDEAYQKAAYDAVRRYL